MGAFTLLLGAGVYFGLQAIRNSAPKRQESQTRTALNEPGKSSNETRSLVKPETAGRLRSVGDSDVPPSVDASGTPPSANKTTLPQPVVNPQAFDLKPDDESKSSAKPAQMVAPATFNSTTPAETADGQMFGSNGVEQPIPTTIKPELGSNEKIREVATTETSTMRESKQDNLKQETQDEDSVKSEEELDEPFDGFPESVELPPTESTDEVILATLKRSSIHLLGMELRSGEGIGKGRISFALERDETTKRQWTLLAKKSPRDSGDPVGQFDFDKASGQINFHWLPKAASSRIANYVRNCAVKMKLGGSSRTLGLRSPVIVPDLKLTRRKPSANVEAEIEWLPDPERITVELLPFTKFGLPKTWIEPAIVQSGTPVIVHFHEAASNRFMWLQLDTSIRKKMSLDLKLMLKHADGTIQPITREGDVKKLESLLKKAAVSTQQEYNANKDVVAPKGKITKFKDYVAKLKSTARKTLRQSEIAGENITIVEHFYDRPIPMRVMFRTDDYQIVLLESAP